MNLLKTFSKKFGFLTEEDDENEMGPDDQEIDEEEDEGDEDEDGHFAFRLPTNPFARKRQTASAPRSRTSARGDEEEDEPARAPRGSNVIHDPRMSAQAASAESQYTHCERIVSVRQIDECRAIIQCLLRGESVLLNLENIDPKDCGRVVDLLSGAAFALQGRMLKVAHLSYLLAPENVEIIEGDIYPANQARYR